MRTYQFIFKFKSSLTRTSFKTLAQNPGQKALSVQKRCAHVAARARANAFGRARENAVALELTKTVKLTTVPLDCYNRRLSSLLSPTTPTHVHASKTRSYTFLRILPCLVTPSASLAIYTSAFVSPRHKPWREGRREVAGNRTGHVGPTCMFCAGSRGSGFNQPGSSTSDIT